MRGSQGDWDGCEGMRAQFAELFWVRLEGGWCGRGGDSEVLGMERGRCGELRVCDEEVRDPVMYSKVWCVRVVGVWGVPDVIGWW